MLLILQSTIEITYVQKCIENGKFTAFWLKVLREDDREQKRWFGRNFSKVGVFHANEQGSGVPRKQMNI